MAKYRKRFRNGSARLKGWDYRNPSAYFITICTHNRQHFFGECTHGTMKLSTMGAIVQGFWYEIPKFSFPYHPKTRFRFDHHRVIQIRLYQTYPSGIPGNRFSLAGTILRSYYSQ